MLVQTNIYLHELKFCQKLHKQKSYNHFWKTSAPLTGGGIDKKNVLVKIQVSRLAQHFSEVSLQREWLPQVIRFRKNTHILIQIFCRGKQIKEKIAIIGNVKLEKIRLNTQRLSLEKEAYEKNLLYRERITTLEHVHRRTKAVKHVLKPTQILGLCRIWIWMDSGYPVFKKYLIFTIKIEKNC